MSTIRRVSKLNPRDPQQNPLSDAPASPGRPTPTPASLPDYQLGEVLGRGAFGCVFRALNWFTGETVAVKQVGLSNIPRSELPEIMSEIDLLKNLDHPNIVQYRGFVKTSDYLYIILEYCENGSLHTICKKFGKFPESLVAVYICQVLEGLLYLHEQGVIHRDIKGSNILATKEGGVKLADFGVATRTGALTDNAVVGSPYWMAPEVVDQSGATTASDIWSVGCVVIELLEGKPPYYFLEPMPALFRIVNDDCPPLPESASPIARDFLLQCFQKDQNLRISAKKLLKHPWMLSAKKRLEQKEREQALAQGRRTPAGNHLNNPLGPRGSNGTDQVGKATGYDETVQRVQDWNKALENERPTNPVHKPLSDVPHSPRQVTSHYVASSPHTAHRSPEDGHLPRSRASTTSRPSHHHFSGTIAPPRAANLSSSIVSPAFDEATMIKNSTIRGIHRPAVSSALPLTAANLPVAVMTATPPARKLAEVGVESPQGDNWDDDFEGGISSSKIAALDHESHTGSSSSGAGGDDGDDAEPNASRRPPGSRDDNSDTIKPPGPAKGPGLERRFKPASSLGAIVEDYSDLVGDDQRDPFEGKVANLKVLNQHQKILHPKDISSTTNSDPSHSFKARLAAASGGQPATPASLDPTRAPSPAPGGLGRPIGHGIPLTRSSSMSSQSPHSPLADEHLNRFTEQAGEDYSDLFGKTLGVGEGREGHSASNETLKLQTRLSNMSSKSWLGDEDSDEVDPFAEVDDDDLTEEPTLEANLARDRLARLGNLVTEIVDQMTPDIDEFALKDGCMQLIGLFEDTPEIRGHFVRSHGMLAVIELLQQFQRSRDLVSLLLRTINLIISDDPESLEKICYNGGCPVVMSFASNKYAREIRLEAALFIGSMCQTSLLTLQMFISCRGLKVLVEMMDENYDEQKDLVWMAVDGICRVFELQGPTPRNDFCRMFAHEGLLDPLSEALLHVSHDDDDLAENAKGRIVHIFLLFSQADMRVKEIMLTRSIILRKFYGNLTMLPSGLQVLQNANTIETLTTLLKHQIERDPDTPLTTEIANHVVNALYNLCRLSKTRQEEAALAGAIPILQRVVKSSSPLKQFALPILCDFAHTSKTCRKLLWQKDGFAFYLGLLRDPFWGITALESILAWLSDETARVEDALTEPSSIEALLRMFTKAKATTFENLLDPLLKLFRMSPAVGAALTSQPTFGRRLVDRLLGHNKAVVRLNLLRLTKAVYETAGEKSAILKMPGLTAGIAKMAESDSAILVRELAKELNREFSAFDQRASVIGRQSGRGGGMSDETPKASKRLLPGSEPGSAASFAGRAMLGNNKESVGSNRFVGGGSSSSSSGSRASSASGSNLFGRVLRRSSTAGGIQRKPPSPA
ncbi:hypothetical protein CROQUDRAFT_41983 [Cronartium quercuum f. sp. fusiforme G11]|uniref:Protein kinase domain-containing protein n=1 Tax=Cronartium quercuum f. sp. fusiforme G11 TaxID=708437 RepID=A0A9P6TET1_9BASI|nr:hypothetical protein CROQUDRAFT_41983 [Cronartium quercuum f. sp. fusiforme G11]